MGKHKKANPMNRGKNCKSQRIRVSGVSASGARQLTAIILENVQSVRPDCRTAK